MKHVLLIIDLRNNFVLEDPSVPQSRTVIPKIPEGLTKFRHGGKFVFHVLRVHRNDGSEVEIIRQPSPWVRSGSGMMLSTMRNPGYGGYRGQL